MCFLYKLVSSCLAHREECVTWLSHAHVTSIRSLPQAKLTKISYRFDGVSTARFQWTATCISTFIRASAVNVALCGSRQSEIVACCLGKVFFRVSLFIGQWEHKSLRCSAGKPQPFEPPWHQFEYQKILLWHTFLRVSNLCWDLHLLLIQYPVWRSSKVHHKEMKK